jgi:hypothetical protein
MFPKIENTKLKNKYGVIACQPESRGEAQHFYFFEGLAL